MRPAATDGIVRIDREQAGECVAQMNARILCGTTVVLSVGDRTARRTGAISSNERVLPSDGHLARNTVILHAMMRRLSPTTD